MIIIYEIIVLIQFLFIDPFVFINICCRATGLCTVSAILRTVSATGVGKNMNAYTISFIFDIVNSLHDRSAHQVLHLGVFKTAIASSLERTGASFSYNSEFINFPFICHRRKPAAFRHGKKALSFLYGYHCNT